MVWMESRRHTLVDQIYFHLPLLRACLLSRLLIYIKLALVYSILRTIQDSPKREDPQDASDWPRKK